VSKTSICGHPQLLGIGKAQGCTTRARDASAELPSEVTPPFGLRDAESSHGVVMKEESFAIRSMALLQLPVGHQLQGVSQQTRL